MSFYSTIIANHSFLNRAYLVIKELHTVNVTFWRIINVFINSLYDNYHIEFD